MSPSSLLRETAKRAVTSVSSSFAPKPAIAQPTNSAKNLFVNCANGLKAKVVKLDKQFIIVNKPNNILSQPDDTGDESLDESVGDFLKDFYQKPGKAFVAVVHRLDRPASGLTVLATTSKAASRLAEQIRERHMKKDYLAVVPLKNVNERQGIIEGTSEDDTLYWKQIHTVDKLYSVLHVKIFSGKKHQIRRQLTENGLGPIIGDLRFNATFQTHKEFPSSKGIMLHASRLSFNHPTRPEEVIDVSFPPPWPEEFLPPFFRETPRRGDDQNNGRYGDEDRNFRRSTFRHSQSNRNTNYKGDGNARRRSTSSTEKRAPRRPSEDEAD